MASDYEPSIFCGAATGLLKSVNLGKRSAANHYGPNELEKNQEIEQMILEDRKGRMSSLKRLSLALAMRLCTIR